MGDSGTVHTQPIICNDVERLQVSLVVDEHGHLQMIMQRENFWNGAYIHREHVDCGDLELWAAVFWDRIGGWVQAQHNLRAIDEWHGLPGSKPGPFSGDLRPATP